MRLRLTAWYVLLLGLTLLLFSFYLHLRLERSLAAQLDDALQVAASQALALVDEAQGHPTHRTPQRNGAQGHAHRPAPAGTGACAGVGGGGPPGGGGVGTCRSWTRYWAWCPRAR